MISSRPACMLFGSPPALAASHTGVTACPFSVTADGGRGEMSAPEKRVDGAGAAAAAGAGAGAVPGPMTGCSVRSQFIDFFASRCGHTEWPSARVVPFNDPTLLFVNAGMNQFKPIFLGNVDAASPLARLRRAVDSQKCIRAGGKHNDLEDVGRDVYHHTFFEMLGNWSFGDYFKAEAIAWAWELLTVVWKLPADRFYVTYFGGDPRCPTVPVDEEARRLWEKYLPAERVLPFGAKENFWEMGDTGPCGPCSEIHFDRVGGRDAAALVNQDDPDVLEVWNLVFMQFNREKDGSLHPLPAPCVDTGMGLERITSVLQNRRSNYDTDLFTPIFDRLRLLLPHLPAYGGRVGAADADLVDTSYRVIADHIRCLVVAIADGALPSNEGRGYVIRRILRRAVRVGQQRLGAPKDRPWFCDLVPAVLDVLASAYPELSAAADNVRGIIAAEERQFAKTLDKGIELFNRHCKKIRAGAAAAGGAGAVAGDGGASVSGAGAGCISGALAFRLYATFGFPYDLTELMASEQGLMVDRAGFDAALEVHRRASEGAGAGAGADALAALPPDALDRLATELRVAPTDDSRKYDWTPGTGTGPSLDTRLQAIWDGKQFVQSVASGEGAPTATGVKLFGLIFEKTTFYAESGGQVGDTGGVVLMAEDAGAGAAGGDSDAEILDTKRYGNYVLHVVAAPLDCAVGMRAKLTVDYSRRAALAQNHTATHLVNYALRKVLAADCDQKGSLVEPSRLRFDFASNAALTDAQIAAVSAEVAAIIAGAAPVDAAEVPLADARKIPGLRAVFGEVYPDPVRVVSVGTPVVDLVHGAPAASSVEFCGGTHLHNSREVGQFVVLAEESLARGVRRLEAATGDAARDALARTAEFVERVRYAGDLQGAELDRAIGALRTELKEVKGRIALQDRRRAADLIDGYAKKRTEEARTAEKALKKEAEAAGAAAGAAAAAGGAEVAVVPALHANFKAMESFVTAFQKAQPKAAVCAISRSEDGGSLAVLAASAPGVAVDAGRWVAAAVAAVGGRGGGKPAQARGTGTLPNAAAFDAACAAAREFFPSK